MKRIVNTFIGGLILINLYSCCKCMNCPGFAQASGGSSDKICQSEYETAQANNPSVYYMTWSQYSDYMLQSGGCTCVE